MDSTGLIKVNPLCRWGFDEVKDYVEMAGVPYNSLLDAGYKSVGDWHSTKAPVEGEDERAGQWSGNKQKTECGLHKDYFKMCVVVRSSVSRLLTCVVFRRKKAFEKKQREQELAATDKARGEDEVGESSVELGLLTI